MNRDLFTKYCFYTVVTVVAVIFLQNTYVAEETFAQTQSPAKEPWASKIQHTGIPFGGLITGKIDCTCEMPKYMIFMWDFSSMGLITLLVDEPKSRLYEVFRLDVNQYALGTYDPVEICSIRVGNDCFDYPTTGVINHGPGVGSSGFMSPTQGTQLLKNAPFSF